MSYGFAHMWHRLCIVRVSVACEEQVRQPVDGAIAVMSTWRMAILGAAVVGGAAVGAAQSPSSQSDIPAGYVPPAGMCRIWLRDVPPMQQPAPTDCRTALRGKPVGSTVIYGPEPKRSSIMPNDWTTRSSIKPTRDDDRSRTPFRSGDDGCTDLNRDGLCDEAASGEPCTDTRDIRCDDTTPAMPAMRSAVQWTEGQRPTDMQRWFGSLNVSARFAMPSRGGSPERVQWFDTDGHLVQVWLDRNGDGRADRVELYGHDGLRVRVVGQ